MCIIPSFTPQLELSAITQCQGQGDTQDITIACLGNASHLGAIYTLYKETADMDFSRRDATKTAKLWGEGSVPSLTWWLWRKQVNL